MHYLLWYLCRQTMPGAMKTIIDKNGNLVKVPVDSNSRAAGSRRTTGRGSNIRTIFSSPTTPSGSQSTTGRTAPNRGNGARGQRGSSNTSRQPNTGGAGLVEPFLSIARMIGMENHTLTLPGMTAPFPTIVLILAVVAYLMFGLTGILILGLVYAYTSNQQQMQNQRQPPAQRPANTMHM